MPRGAPVVTNLDQQTLRLAIERLEEACAMVRDIRARRGQPWSIERLLEISTTIERLKALVLQ